MPGFCKHFCLDVSPAHGRHSRSCNQHQQKQQQPPDPAEPCVILKLPTTSVTWEPPIWELQVWNPSPVGCWGSAALALCEQHLHMHFLHTSFFFVCYLFVLSCSLKVSDGNQNLLALFKRYCGSPGRARNSQRNCSIIPRSAKAAGCLTSLCTQECLTRVTSLALENLYNPLPATVSSAESGPSKNTHVVIYDFGLPSKSFPK